MLAGNSFLRPEAVQMWKHVDGLAKWTARVSFSPRSVTLSFSLSRGAGFLAASSRLHEALIPWLVPVRRATRGAPREGIPRQSSEGVGARRGLGKWPGQHYRRRMAGESRGCVAEGWGTRWSN